MVGSWVTWSMKGEMKAARLSRAAEVKRMCSAVSAGGLRGGVVGLGVERLRESVSRGGRGGSEMRGSNLSKRQGRSLRWGSMDRLTILFSWLCPLSPLYRMYHPGSSLSDLHFERKLKDRKGTPLISSLE